MNILEIGIGGSSFGGVERFLMQVYQKLSDDNTAIDFLFLREDPLSSASGFFGGSKIIALGAKSDSLRDYGKIASGIDAVLKKRSYDVVHINTGSLLVTFACVLIAKRDHIKTIIAHSHSTHAIGRAGSIPLVAASVKWFSKRMQSYIRNNSSYLLACSYEAADALYGKEVGNSKNFFVIHNAVDIPKFKYDTVKRKALRMREGIDDSYTVLGHVGRFDENKNQVYLVRLCKELLDQSVKCVLWLIGEGNEKKSVEAYVKEVGVCDSVKFWGNRKDVNQILQGMDVLLLPSRYEGLSIVAVEAQTSGLPVILSDTLSKEHKITDNVAFAPIDNGYNDWIELIKKFRVVRRVDTSEAIRNAGYDIEDEIKKIRELYEGKR